MKVISIYELLGLIKDGKAPKKIKYENREYYLYDNKSYLSTDKTRFFDRIYFGEDYLRAELNDEVEIIEEVEDKEYEDIEKLGDFDITEESFDDKELGLKLGYTGVSNTFNDVYFKINALIKNQKKIIERLNKEN